MTSVSHLREGAKCDEHGQRFCDPCIDEAAEDGRMSEFEDFDFTVNGHLASVLRKADPQEFGAVVVELLQVRHVLDRGGSVSLMRMGGIHNADGSVRVTGRYRLDEARPLT